MKGLFFLIPVINEKGVVERISGQGIVLDSVGADSWLCLFPGDKYNLRRVLTNATLEPYLFFETAEEMSTFIEVNTASDEEQPDGEKKTPSGRRRRAPAKKSGK